MKEKESSTKFRGFDLRQTGYSDGLLESVVGSCNCGWIARSASLAVFLTGVVHYCVGKLKIG